MRFFEILILVARWDFKYYVLVKCTQKYDGFYKCIGCMIRCLYIDVSVCFVESIVKLFCCFWNLNKEKVWELKNEVSPKKTRNNSNRYKMDFMLNREYLKIINSNWWTKFRLKLIIPLECEFGVLKVFVNYEINRICSIIFEYFIVKSV